MTAEMMLNSRLMHLLAQMRRTGDEPDSRRENTFRTRRAQHTASGGYCLRSTAVSLVDSAMAELQNNSQTLIRPSVNNLVSDCPLTEMAVLVRR